jgi:hypothetical protein
MARGRRIAGRGAADEQRAETARSSEKHGAARDRAAGHVPDFVITRGGYIKDWSLRHMEGLDTQQRRRLAEAQLDDCSHPSEVIPPRGAREV